MATLALRPAPSSTRPFATLFAAKSTSPNVRVASANSRNVRVPCLSAAERSRLPSTRCCGCSALHVPIHLPDCQTTRLVTRQSFSSQKKADNCSIIQSGRSSGIQWPHPSAMPPHTSAAKRLRDSTAPIPRPRPCGPPWQSTGICSLRRLSYRSRHGARSSQQERPRPRSMSACLRSGPDALGGRAHFPTRVLSADSHPLVRMTLDPGIEA